MASKSLGRGSAATAANDRQPQRRQGEARSARGVVPNGVGKDSDSNDINALSSAMNRLVSEDSAAEGFHHTMVREGIVKRYAFATRLRENPRLFKLWKLLPRVQALPRPPKKPDQAFQALCNATYADKRKASKYWCRVREIWKNKSPSSDVREFLKTHGIEKDSAERKPPPKNEGELPFFSLVFQSKLPIDAYASAEHIVVSGRIDTVKGIKIFLKDVVTSIPRDGDLRK